MHEREKDAATIDVTAARINASAAEIAKLVDERARSAHTQEMIGGFRRAEPSEADNARRDELHREKAIAAEMATAVEAIREASGRLQELAADLRQPEIPVAA